MAVGWPGSAWKDIILSEDNKVYCPKCKKKRKADLLLHYFVKGITAGGGGPISGRVVEKHYSYICKTCNKSWEVEETPEMEEIALEMIPWRDQQGLRRVIIWTSVIIGLMFIGGVIMTIIDLSKSPGIYGW